MYPVYCRIVMDVMLKCICNILGDNTFNGRLQRLENNDNLTTQEVGEMYAVNELKRSVHFRQSLTGREGRLLQWDMCRCWGSQYIALSKRPTCTAGFASSPESGLEQRALT